MRGVGFDESWETSAQGSMANLPGGEDHLVLGGGGISIFRGDASIARVAASDVSKMARVARSRLTDVLVVSYCGVVSGRKISIRVIF